ncbi:MAG TPA: efflux RND transporter periplasmic adaptor subunit [Polyangiaceae bacterium]|jgi:HlyD family secretion protein|nr:efflux RND transporter periplasmic adaptor subunit [Polyangiaceae bacterium]
MRRVIPWLLVLSVLAAFAWTLLFLYRKAQTKPVVWRTVAAEYRDVVKKTVATGSIVPRREVLIKSRVSGVLHKLSAVPGQLVKAGSLLGEVKILPNVVNVGNAEARLESARISLANAEREYERNRGLYREQLISQGEFNRADLDLSLAKQELKAATDNVALVKEGAIKGSHKGSNQIVSTVDGMVIDVPVKEGATVIEANTFNEGTTIAAVADMADLIFQGKVDESEVGKLKSGMPTTIRIGALQGERFEGQLEYLSPKGVEKEGTIEFEIRARIDLKPGLFIRDNYSAAAEIVLARAEHVLTLPESVIHFDDTLGQAEPSNPSAGIGDRRQGSVEVELSPQVFERRNIEVGLSDGIYTQVLQGLTASDHVKLPNPGELP